VAGLGRALLSAGHPSWRLPPIPDAAARRLRHVPSVLAATLFLGWFLQRLTELAQLSLPTLVAIRAVVALVLALVLARLLARWSDREPGPVAAAAARPLGLVMILVPGLARALLVLAALAIFAGYVALGSFLVGQMAWTLILVCGGYAAWILVGDVADAWASGASTQAPEAGLPPRLELRRHQAAVLLSGGLRILLLLLLVVLLLAPFGEGPGELLGRGQWLREGVAVGQLQLRPAAIAQALAVAVGVFIAARAFQRWTADRLLPTTALDEGMRSSIVALVGFLGGVLAVAMGLSAMGLALTQVAWIASALTVGIGFGMQSIVSNFVSGLILLAERPVKVGDWVALSGLEGDIRRMNVRTTEIQMPDRSTVIVPNSEFITKVVRNVTHDTQAQGLVQIRLPMPLDTDTERVRATLLQAFREHEEILRDPPANVLLDGIEGDKLIFSATGFVASPRRVAAARSELLFRIMPALRSGDAAAGP
jgi:small-conductance mechanosensitive channel